MTRLIAEIKPLDILVPIVALAVGFAIVWVGLALIARFFYLLVQPLYAIATGREVEEDSWWVWGGIVVAGLVYWQLS
jgi:hypothetical protein